MRTRAQATRDAALMRLRRVNRSLTIAAVVGTGVVVDVVAQTPLGHASAHTIAKTAATRILNAPSTRKSTPAKHSSATTGGSDGSSSGSDGSSSGSSSSGASATVTPAVAPVVTPVVVSGGS